MNQAPGLITGDAWQRGKCCFRSGCIEERRSGTRIGRYVQPVDLSAAVARGARPRVMTAVNPLDRRCRLAAEVHSIGGTVDVVECELLLLRRRRCSYESDRQRRQQGEAQ